MIIIPLNYKKGFEYNFKPFFPAFLSLDKSLYNPKYQGEKEDKNGNFINSMHHP